MPRLEIHDAARRRRFEILDDAFSAGSGAEDVLRLGGDGVGTAHLRFDRDARERVRLVAAPGALLNGDEVARAVLGHGDRIEVGPYLLVFCEDGQESPDIADEDIPAVRAERAAARARGEGLVLDISAPIGARPSAAPKRARVRAGESPVRKRTGGARGRATPESEEGSERRRTPVARRGMPTSMILWNGILVSAVVLWLVYRSFAAAPLVRDPEDIIELAEAQWNSGHVDEAYSTLRAARERAVDNIARRKIDAAVRGLEAKGRQLEDLARVREAREAYDDLLKFSDRWFDRADDKRPAAREVERRIRDWDEAYAAVCRDYEDGRFVLEALGVLRDRVAPHHHLDEPDTAADVLFRSDRYTKLNLRRYRQAFELLEQWLAEQGGANGAERVRRELQRLREDGPAWVADQREAIERMVQREEIGRAVGTLRFLVDEALPAEWLDDLPARLDALEAQLAEGR